jgi:hypothetical protein
MQQPTRTRVRLGPSGRTLANHAGTDQGGNAGADGELFRTGMPRRSGPGKPEARVSLIRVPTS